MSVGPLDNCGPNYAYAYGYGYNGGYGYGNWTLSYSYEVVGPQTELLTAAVSYFVLASAGGQGFAFANASTTIGDAGGSFVAQASVKLGGSNVFCGVSTNSGLAGGCGYYVYNTNVQVMTNTLYTVTLAADAEADSEQGTSASAFAYADPSISIDASANPGYSVQVSDGILNQVTPLSPVPLPAAAWLMLSGLGGLGALSRKKITI